MARSFVPIYGWTCLALAVAAERGIPLSKKGSIQKQQNNTNNTNAKLTNIQDYKKRWNMNIGIVIFGIIFIYLVVSIGFYITSEHVSVYEVREGSILKDNAYTGLAIRQEKVIAAPKSGYVNFFPVEGSKVRVGENLYSISQQELDLNTALDQEAQQTTLSSEEQKAVSMRMQSFGETFRPTKFSDVYTLRAEMQTILNSNTTQDHSAALTTLIEQQEAASCSVYTAEDDGILFYATDGYEDLTISNYTDADLNKETYVENSVSNNSHISQNEPTCKLITSEYWTIVIKLNQETAKKLKEKTSINVRFDKDNQTLIADLRIVEKENQYYGYLQFDNSMIRYSSERYLDVELIMENETGLKIPKSAKVEQSFFLVPAEYLTQGGNDNAVGVMRKTGDDSVQFIATKIYYRDIEQDYVYLSKNDLQKNDILIRPDSNETMVLTETKKLPGVYNINRGYAIFKPIEILTSSEEYYIVQSGNTYSLTNYDHIALDGSKIDENDVVF